MKRVLIALILIYQSVQAKEYLSSLIVSDAKNHNVLGTASHICFTLNQDTPYLVTAAHVIEGVKELEGKFKVDSDSSIKLKRLKVDSEMDLAVLVPELSPQELLTMGVSMPCHSTTIFAEPVQAEAFDVLATYDNHIHRLEIEGYDSELKALRTETINAPVVKSIQSGIPGREAVGQVYMTTFRARPGFSGGVVLGYTDNGKLKNHTETTDYSGKPVGNRRVFLGLIVAADQSHNRVAMIPGSVVMKWFSVFSDRQNTRENTTTTLGGLFNQDLKAYISTPTDSMTSVGLSSFGGVGTGRPAVGSPQAMDRNVGVILQEQKEKRWLSIGDNWVEGNPINSKTKEVIQNNRQNIQGIYLDSKGNIQKTEGTSFPKIFGVQEMNKILSQNHSECSSIQMKNINTGKIVNTKICEKTDEGSADYSIESEAFEMKVNMQVVNGQIQIKSQMGSEPAQALSLRRFQNQKYNIKIEGLSGFEIQDKESGQTWVGPMK